MSAKSPFKSPVGSSDSEQALTFNDFSYMMNELAQVPIMNDHVG